MFEEGSATRSFVLTTDRLEIAISASTTLALRKLWSATASRPMWRDLLRRAERFEVFELDPERNDSATTSPQAVFRDWRIVQQVHVDRTEFAPLYRTLVDVGFRDIGPALCFIPHHGCSAVIDGKRLELVLCFTCGSAIAWWDNQPIDPPRIRMEARDHGLVKPWDEVFRQPPSP